MLNCSKIPHLWSRTPEWTYPHTDCNKTFTLNCSRISQLCSRILWIHIPIYKIATKPSRSTAPKSLTYEAGLRNGHTHIQVATKPSLWIAPEFLNCGAESFEYTYPHTRLPQNLHAQLLQNLLTYEAGFRNGHTHIQVATRPSLWIAPESLNCGAKLLDTHTHMQIARKPSLSSAPKSRATVKKNSWKHLPTYRFST